MTSADIFGHTGQVGWGQECARAALIFIYGLLLVRTVGRRVFGKWAALDIVVSIVVGSNLSRALTGNAPLFGTLLATTLLMALHWVLSHAGARAPWLSRILEGTPIELAKSGRADSRKLLVEAISQGDLDEALRASGVETVGDTRLIMLEPSGKISVLKAK